MLASFLIGTQFILAFLTLVFYLRVKNKAYLYYAMHVICIVGYAAFCWARIDNDFKGAFFKGPTAHYFRYLALFSTLAMIGMVNFIRYFLSLYIILPRWDKMMKYLGWVGKIIFATVFLCFTPIVNAPHVSARLLEFYVFVVSAAGIVFTLPLIQHIRSVDKYFVIGFCSLLAIASIALILRVMGNPYFYYLVFATILTESILFALALVEQQNQKDRERNKAIIELEKTKNQQVLNQLENTRIKELEGVRSSFYTNLTHEFRTPLTVIMGLAESIKSNFSDAELQKSGEFILRNSKNVLNMINQLLDIAKSDVGNLSLDLSKGDIVNSINFFSESFFALAAEKKIQLSFQAEPTSLIADFDADKLKHIVQNILFNALKYTNPGGKIMVHFSKENNNTLSLIFKDTGVGIQEEDLPHIFERFYQAKNSSAGTGIGLSLSKEFVELMNGKIEVNSEVAWGTEIKITLPIINLPNTPLLDIGIKSLKTSNHEELKPVLLYSDSDTLSDLPLILIVEDNIGVITYIQSLLKDKYQIIIGVNGKEGLNLALERIPDVIVTDVMMPEMNGYELANRLKQDIRTSHIPIIMLTAKADQKSKISGLEVGADVYLSKPFERKEFLLQITNLIKSRLVLIEKYTNLSNQSRTQISKIENTVNVSSNIEDQFISQLNNLLDTKIGVSDIVPDQIAFQLELSPSQLQRKLKALTNQTIKQYIKSRQLYKAQALLQDPSLSISDIGYQVGYNDLNYFIRVFKNEFGKPPGVFRKEMQPIA